MLDGGPDHSRGRGQFWVENVAAHCKVIGHSRVSCAKTAEPIDVPFWLKTRVGQRNHVLDGDAVTPTGRGSFRRCRVRCKMDHSIANNVMQQKGSFSMLGKCK